MITLGWAIKYILTLAAVIHSCLMVIGGGSGNVYCGLKVIKAWINLHSYCSYV